MTKQKQVIKFYLMRNNNVVKNKYLHAIIRIKQQHINDLVESSFISKTMFKFHQA